MFVRRNFAVEIFKGGKQYIIYANSLRDGTKCFKQKFSRCHKSNGKYDFFLDQQLRKNAMRIYGVEEEEEEAVTIISLGLRQKKKKTTRLYMFLVLKCWTLAEDRLVCHHDSDAACSRIVLVFFSPP